MKTFRTKWRAVSLFDLWKALASQAALLPDVRKGLAFPDGFADEFHRGYAASKDLEAKPRRSFGKLCSVSLLVLVLLLTIDYGVAAQTTKPRTFLLNAQNLVEALKRIQSGDKALLPALARLESDARKALKEEPVSVVTKSVTPPSGDKHDYMSQAPYFWPDPSKPNGLPYLRRDGERNPEINKITDHQTLDQMEAAVRTLALAYYFTKNEAYAAKATQFLRAWFLDAPTRMNPNLEYAQFIPGVNTGRGIGLIETRGLTDVVDGIGLLAGSKSLTGTDQKGLKVWFASFLKWMRESKNGNEENAAKNNHGTYFDVQATSFALFLGQTTVAREIVETAKQKRIALQIEPDGRQPLELVRTKAWGYSNGNLDGLLLLARLAENVNVDLWNYQTKDGRSIRRALEYLYPFSIGQKQWTDQQLGGFDGRSLFPLMRRAAAHYQDEKFKEEFSRISALDPADRENLVSGK